MAGGPRKAGLTDRESTSLYADDTALTPLQRISVALEDRYVVEREIGSGGAAHVYLAYDRQENRNVAVKVLRPELAAATGEDRFRREIEIARRLDHPNIQPLLDFGSVDSQLYFTMPFVEGQTLRHRIREEKQLRLRDALDITRDIARALDYAHDNGVVHRDVKPANVLLDKDRTLVADFGIARAMIVASGDRITTDSGLVVGTVEYMSPEQAEGHRQLDARSDIYSLGCVVYEMLAGEPPFTGATAQAVVARHCYEQPRSIRVIRPSIPLGVERAIEKALAKVPADRFETASAFVDALHEGLEYQRDWFGLTRLSGRTRAAAGTILVTLVAAGVWYTVVNRSPVLDPGRIVVFPLNDPAGTTTVDGEAVATFVGYALDATRPLKWMDGWELLGRGGRTTDARLTEREGRKLARRAGAGFFIDGSILRRPDSSTIILRLHDVVGDSILRVDGRSAAAVSASLPLLGLQAVRALLPSLVAPGGKMDLSALSERSPAAVANFLQGERAYRRMQFHAALPHYELAVREDSAFALAALRGAYAATWLSDFGTATQLANVALRRRSSLPTAQALLGRGLYAYLTGSADSAVHHLQAALRSDSTQHVAWTLLGETYLRLLPNEGFPDSLGRRALEQARLIDPAFAPTLLLLEEIAFRDGDVDRATRLRRELREAGADTTHTNSREIMRRCVTSGPSSIDWPAAARRDENAVLSSGKMLAGGGSQPNCAIAAFRAILETSGTKLNTRWGAFLALEAILAATNQRDLAADVFSWPGVADLPRSALHVLLASAGMGFDAEASLIADSTARSYAAASVPKLWALGLWEARHQNVRRLNAIVRELRQKADSSQARRDRLVFSAIAARVPLLEGDTAAAIRKLRELAPTATRQALAWDPFESLGAERVLLGELLYARRQFHEALRIASLIDAAEPLVYPIYLRASLDLRARSAAAMGNENLAAAYRRRLNRLSPRD